MSESAISYFLLSTLTLITVAIASPIASFYPPGTVDTATTNSSATEPTVHQITPKASTGFILAIILPLLLVVIVVNVLVWWLCKTKGSQWFCNNLPVGCKRARGRVEEDNVIVGEEGERIGLEGWKAAERERKKLESERKELEKEREKLEKQRRDLMRARVEDPCRTSVGEGREIVMIRGMQW